MSASEQKTSGSSRWLNATTLGVGLTSLLSDWSHEMATAILPALLMSFGAGPGWLGAIEGVADVDDLHAYSRHDQPHDNDPDV